MSNISTSPARSRAWSSRRAVSALGLMALVGGLLFTASAPAGAAYPGDNGRIAFESTRTSPGGLATGDEDIWSVNPDGSGLMQLTVNAFELDVDPSWSPDGERIAFANCDLPIIFLDLCTSDYDIWTMAADGSDLEQVTDTSIFNERNPTWSPDGDLLAFEHDGEIAVTDADGSGGITELTTAGGENPTWSPTDGDLIVYEEGGDILSVDGVAPGLGVIDTLVSLGTDGAPDFSPDGDQLIVERPDFPFQGLEIMDADGTPPLTPLPFSFGASDPAFSPDGERVVTELGGDLSIRPADGADSGFAQVTATGDNADPSWQPADFPAPAQVLVPVLPGFHRLSVVRTGSGTGTVTSSPAGVDCGSDCLHDYATGTVVTLTAAPTGGSSLGSWNVAGCSGLTCAITMSADTTVNPVFNAPAAAAAAASPLDPRCGQPLVICGTLGNDILIGGSAGELILPFAGNDNTKGGGGNDIIVDPSGNNIIRGGPGNDQMTGGPGRDHMRGGGGNDDLSAGAGKDRLIGGKGHDVCDDGPGKDFVKGCEA